MMSVLNSHFLVALSLLVAPLLAAQQDQLPRAPKKDDRGLLQINREYFDLAARTGGDYYFWAAGEFGSARVQIPVHHDGVLLSYGALESKKSFEIPVESGVKELTLFAGIQRKDLAVLVRPDGTVVRDVQSFQHMLIATVNAPATGIWHLELQGAGTYAVTAHVKRGDGSPELINFAFVETGGRRAGESLACRVALSGLIEQAELAFVTKDGSPIGNTPITANSEGEYAGRCTIPDGPFRVVVRGVDAKGARFQRIESPLRYPE
jgi:hypothetical protein